MRLRLTAVLLIVTLVVVAGCSMRTAKAAVEKDLTLNSRQYNGATENLGQMYLDGQGPYNLPHNTRVLAGTHMISFIPPVGFYWVALEIVAPTGKDTIVVNPFLFERTPRVPCLISEEDPTVTAVYQQIGLPAYVGGVLLPTSTYAIFAPYLAVICLVAAAAAVAVKKRRN